MNIDLSKVPRKAWIIIAWGIFLVLVSWAIRGTLSFKTETKAPEKEIEIEVDDFRMEQRGYGGVSIKKTTDGVEITK